MTKIYENDERDKLLPISITTNFILRTSRVMLVFVIKRCLCLVFHRLKIQIAWGAFLVENPDLLTLMSTDLSSYSAIQHSCTPSSTCSFIFFRRGEPYPFFNDRSSQNSNCSERKSFQIMRFDRWSAKDWALHTEIDVEIKWGEFNVFCHQTWNFTKKYCQFHVQQPIASWMCSHSRAIWHHLKAKSFF
jgi:hypothetical protein